MSTNPEEWLLCEFLISKRDKTNNSIDALCQVFKTGWKTGQGKVAVSQEGHVNQGKGQEGGRLPGGTGGVTREEE